MLNKVPDKTTARQREISQATVRAQEQERNRISTELHDNVNQLVATAKMHIGIARSGIGCGDDALENAESCLASAIEAIKVLTHRLCTKLVVHDGLVKSIGSIVTTMRTLNINARAEVDGDLVEKLSEEQQLMVYRIVQEQSNNILKYAGAQAATIGLRGKEEWAELVVADNGRGFDPGLQKKRSGGIGFINIDNRARAFNGTVEINSAPGKGCTLIVRFPLAEPPEAGES